VPDSLLNNTTNGKEADTHQRRQDPTTGNYADPEGRKDEAATTSY